MVFISWLAPTVGIFFVCYKSIECIFLICSESLLSLWYGNLFCFEYALRLKWLVCRLMICADWAVHSTHEFRIYKDLFKISIKSFLIFISQYPHTVYLKFSHFSFTLKAQIHYVFWKRVSSHGNTFFQYITRLLFACWITSFYLQLYIKKSQNTVYLSLYS